MKIMVELKIEDRYAGQLMDHVTAAVREFEDSIRCPSVSKTGDLRCELYADHSPNERHRQGNESWPNGAYGIEIGRVVVGRLTGGRYKIDSYDESYVWLTGVDRTIDGGKSRVEDFWDRYRAAE